MKTVGLLLLVGLLAASDVAFSAPPAGRGPKPPPEGDCRLDISGRMQCAYPTYDECRAALRAFRREQVDLASGCWLSTADPNWWHYDQYVLEYYP